MIFYDFAHVIHNIESKDLINKNITDQILFNRVNVSSAAGGEIDQALYMDSKNINEVSGEIIGAAIEVHKAIGPGLLESAYEACLCHELMLRNVNFEAQLPIPVVYKKTQLDCGYRLDLLVEKLVIIELKASESIQPIHKAQIMTYLKLMDKQLGLILNFNVPLMRNGIQRVVNGLDE